jgi:hypothetical protein
MKVLALWVLNAKRLTLLMKDFIILNNTRQILATYMISRRKKSKKKKSLLMKRESAEEEICVHSIMIKIRRGILSRAHLSAHQVSIISYKTNPKNWLEVLKVIMEI